MAKNRTTDEFGPELKDQSGVKAHEVATGAWELDAAGNVVWSSLEAKLPRIERRPRMLTHAQLAAIADYHRARQGFPSDAELASVLAVSPHLIVDWKHGEKEPSAENARHLSHLAVVVAELAEFLDPDVIPDWFMTQQHTLGGRTPAEALDRKQLADVLHAVNATEHGAYI